MPTSLTLELVTTRRVGASGQPMDADAGPDPVILREGSSASIGGPEMTVPLPGAVPGEVWARVRYLDGWRVHCAPNTRVSLDGGQWRTAEAIGDTTHRLTLQRADQNHFLTATVSETRTPDRRTGRDWLRLGTDPLSDFRLDGLDIDKVHAEYLPDADGGITVRDRSRLGTFVNGQPILRARVPDGGTFVVGGRTVRNRNGELELVPRRRDASAPPLVAAVHLASHYRNPKDRGLRNVSFTLGRQELLAVIGPSGAGKSSLFKTLLGEITHATGDLRLNGEPVSSLPYVQAALVPQRDDMPNKLTVDQLLHLVMDLRSSRSASASAKHEQVELVLKQLGLVEKRGSNVERLSGGQAKRVSVTLELLAAPEILLLDEPTSGLDEGMDRSLMTTLSDLAGAENGTGVLIVTHSMANLGVADRVLALAKGGTTSYLGAPTELLDAYAVESHADVMLQLADQRMSRVSVPHHDDHSGRRPTQGQVEKPRSLRFPMWTLLKGEARRAFPWLPPDGDELYKSRWAQFVTPLALKLLAIPLGIVMAAWVAGGHGLKQLTDDGLPNPDLSVVISVLTIFTALISAALTTGQFVKDDGYLHRLHRWRIGTPAMVLAKFAVHGGVAVALGAMTASLYLLFKPGPEKVGWVGPSLNLLVTLVLLSCASAALGLAISSTTDSIETAMYLMMGFAVLQVIFSGMLIHQADWPWFSRMATWGLPTRWGVAALASASDLNQYLGGNADSLWGHDVRHVVTAWLSLAAIIAGSLVVAMLSLRYRLSRKA